MVTIQVERSRDLANKKPEHKKCPGFSIQLVFTLMFYNKFKLINFSTIGRHLDQINPILQTIQIEFDSCT